MFYIVEVVEQCDCSWDKTISCVVMFKDTSCQKSRKKSEDFLKFPPNSKKQTNKKNQYWANRMKKIVPYSSCQHHWSQILYCHCDLAGNWSRTKFLPKNMLAPLPTTIRNLTKNFCKIFKIWNIRMSNSMFFVRNFYVYLISMWVRRSQKQNIFALL